MDGLFLAITDRGTKSVSFTFRETVVLVLAGWICWTTAAASAAVRSPLPMEKNPELYQRIITLPGASLYTKPAETAEIGEHDIPIFEVFYVYGRDSNWVEVGRSLKGPPEGWIEKTFTQDWSIMLVMQYAPPGQRERVLFFEKENALIDLIVSPKVGTKSHKLLLEADKGENTGGIIAVEEMKEGFVSFEGSPYLMPITDFRRERFDDGTDTTLVEVASVSANQKSTRAGNAATSIADARRAIVFVIDTTISMQPYIEQVLRTVRNIYAEVGKTGLLNRTSFGLIGYRNNMDEEPQKSGLEYVSKIYQGLDPGLPPDRILKSLERMKASNVPTHSWNEDAVAGLYDALWKIDWDPFRELRLVILITDAGALQGDDPKSHHHERRIGLLNVQQKAIQDHVAIVTLHLLTPEARQAGNIPIAQRQYSQLGQTGDINVRKYIGIEAGSVSMFAQQLDGFAAELGNVVKRAGRGVVEPKTTLETVGGNLTLGSLFRNEVYSAQQRYLGEVRGADAAIFYRAWASDKDLTQPKRIALDVSVFLTKKQLNELAQSLDRLVERGLRAKEAPDTFFALLRALAVSTSTDPERYGVGFDYIAESRLLPSFLKLLPYKSRIMRLNEDTWRDLGPTGQSQLIFELQEKLSAYKDINEDSRKWKALGDRDDDSKVYPIPLELLP